MYIYICVYIYICIYIYISYVYVYIYIYINTSQNNLRAGTCSYIFQWTNCEFRKNMEIQPFQAHQAANQPGWWFQHP